MEITGYLGVLAVFVALFFGGWYMYLLKKEKDSLLLERDDLKQKLLELTNLVDRSHAETINAMKHRHEHQLQVLHEANKEFERSCMDNIKKILTCGTITQAHGMVKDILNKMAK